MLKIPECSVGRVDIRVIGYIVTIIAPGRRKERKQPDCRYAQVLEIVQLAGKPAEIPHPISVAIAESLYMDLVNDRVLVPEGVAFEIGRHTGFGRFRGGTS